ncbi:hypothetical protein Gotri_018758 [Gossypium trilobum]|uniref:AB hydrolase-1 domain-containing protein n=1 Tax=Gossypium trilobum TaxID=34281 RepID=A0A7J9EAM2_9ROSI|nr:hypothetical protein [Gossypium trilobum]
MNEVSHRRIKTNGIWVHIAEQGRGPLVLLLHGFPEIWYSWRHQISFLANHGYHVVAPDLRGYGDSDSPLSPSSYTFMHYVGDIIGLLDHLGEQQVFPTFLVPACLCFANLCCVIKTISTGQSIDQLRRCILR